MFRNVLFTESMTHTNHFSQPRMSKLVFRKEGQKNCQWWTPGGSCPVTYMVSTTTVGCPFEHTPLPEDGWQEYCCCQWTILLFHYSTSITLSLCHFYMYASELCHPIGQCQRSCCRRCQPRQKNKKESNMLDFLSMHHLRCKITSVMLHYMSVFFMSKIGPIAGNLSAITKSGENQPGVT